MTDYIDLNRRFSDFRPVIQEWDDWTVSGYQWASPYTWDKILQDSGTVVIAEGGTGKSREFKERALILRKEGKAAFFCPIEQLTTLALGSALEIGSKEELVNWLRGDAEGWFFLDAVDEAKLVNPRHFEAAIAKFVEVLEPHLERARIVISSRPHAFEATDREMLCRRLKLSIVDPKAKQNNSDDETDDEAAVAGGEAGPGATQENAKKAAPPPLHIVQLSPLSKDQIGIFAEKNGVTDVTGFLEALEHANADVFANRPSDLPGLIETFRKTKRIGRFSDVVLQNIELKLKEVNPRHVGTAFLSMERALHGAERLAAAVTVTRKPSLLLPDRSVLDAKVRDELLDPKDVLLDWRPGEVQELLGRALFDESLFGAVRFHHRTAREYLAARWFGRLLRQGKHRRSIQNLFFSRPYGAEKPVVVPSMKPVAGWVALWDQDIRDQIIKIDPKVLLEFGDASALPVDIRASLLNDFAARYATQPHTPLSLNLREVRRLADQQLAPTIRELLQQYRDHTDVRQLLLRLIREGRIGDCGELVLYFANDGGMDEYTRTVAIEAVGAAGTASQRAELRSLITANPAERVLAAVVKALYPANMTVAELLTILAQTDSDDEDKTDSLQHEITTLVQESSDPAGLLGLLDGLVGLLNTPPLHADWCRISRRYEWLLTPAMVLASRLVAARPNSPFPASVLTAILMATEADHLHIYTGDARKDALKLNSENAVLRHALFWHDAALTRRIKPTERLTEWWRLHNDSSRDFRDEDAERFIAALAERPELDDKLLALSVLMFIYKQGNRPPAIMNRIKDATAGTPELETALAGYLKPPAPSADDKASRARLRAMERRSKERKARKEKQRRDGIEWLKANVAKLAIGDFAKEGRSLQSIVYLLREVASGKNSGSRWTVTGWRRLIPEFGNDVAEAFRDHCIAYWRLYRPQLRSEIGRDTNSTPNAVIVGLSGIGMEALGRVDWVTTLTPEEAALATRYALWELNGFPPWLEQLAAHHGGAVADVLQHEILWETSQADQVNPGGYVLARLRWYGGGLRTLMRPRILEMLLRNEVRRADTLLEAISLILREPGPLPQEFVALAAKCATETVDIERKSIWIAAHLCLDAQAAVGPLETWVGAAADGEEAEARASAVLNHVWGDRREGLKSHYQSYQNAAILVRLLKLAHTHVRLDEDIEHKGAYSPGVRDRAQDARDHLIRILYELPGRPTYDGLLDLSRFHIHENARQQRLILAERRAEADTEREPWPPSHIEAFARDAERAPRSQEELLQLALDRLDDLKLDLEEGDESEASILRRVKNEVELRKLIANRLKHNAAGKYTTGSEEELADATRTDIRLHHPAVEARVPIEVKIADKRWSGEDLLERLTNQVVGQYLRTSKCGVMLLVRRGNPKDRKSWTHPDSGKALNFPELLAWLQSEADSLCRANPSIERLAVVGIDLVRRSVRPAAAKRSGSRRKKTT